MKVMIIYFRYYREVRVGSIAGGHSGEDSWKNLNEGSVRANWKPKESMVFTGIIRWDIQG